MTRVSNSPLTAGKDRSGTSTGASQLVAAANPNRTQFDFQNISDTDMWITETLAAAAASTQGCWKVAAGQVWSGSTNRDIYAYCSASGKAFTAIEMG